MTAEQIFNRLWDMYITQTPDAKKVYDLFKAQGEEVVNDHIAFRTFDDDRINVDVLSKVFLKAGYVEKGHYKFEAKKLFAKHFEHPEEGMPRVFISQLITAEFSEELQEEVRKFVDAIPEDLLKSDDLIFSGRPEPAGKPSYETYNKLRSESEYAAWLYIYGFRANHFTVSVNHLKTIKGIYAVNDFLKENGFMMNSSGGEVKGTPEELLEQSSIKAGIVEMDFVEGTYSVPSCYYEFAMRYADAQGELYSGFIAKSADKIFESTDFYKK